MTTWDAYRALEEADAARDGRSVDALGSEPPVKPSFELRGLSHAEALARDVPPTSEIVANIVEEGTVGEISGLPETHKSFVAGEIASKVAAGRGLVLGRFPIIKGGPVGYVWQDDSEANELRRLQAYAKRHGHEGDLPIRWYLNEGLRLPEHVDELRRIVERDRLVLLVLDSLYNIATGDLKDEAIGGLYDLVKREVCNPTSCTILVVDHSPWPTDGNRGQRRSYGSVFKAAAIRWAIHLERVDDTLFAQAHGNNVDGFKRTAAIWLPEDLEVRLVEATPTEGDLGDRLEDFLRRNLVATQTVIEAGVTGQATQIRSQLEGDERFVRVPPALAGKPSNAKCWALAENAQTLIRDTFTNPVAGSDGVATGLPERPLGPTPSRVPHLRSRGDGVEDDVALPVAGTDGVGRGDPQADRYGDDADERVP